MHPAIRVAVENATYAYDKLYSYRLPAEMAAAVRPGCRVTVPFGGGNRSRTAVVVEYSDEDAASLKPAAALLDDTPLLTEEGLFLLRYLHDNTFCTWFDAFRLLVPTGLSVVYKTLYKLGTLQPEGQLSLLQIEIISWLRERRSGAEETQLCGYFGIEKTDRDLAALLAAGVVVKSEQTGRKIGDDKVCMVRLTPDAGAGKLTPKQKLVLAFLEENEAVSLGETCYYTGVTRSVVDGLRRRGQVDFFDAVRYRSPFEEEILEVAAPPALSPAQQAAYEQLAALADEASPAPALLYGVTGSGKTEVFLRLVAEVRSRGKTALILVPEISLTAQAVESFRRRFGSEVAVLHSGLSLGERMDEWRRIRAGEAVIVVGTRSAVFAPLENLGLIVIDEEQEHTYRSDKTPRYHAREVALVRSRLQGALLVLASATPAIETFFRAKQGKYHLVKLAERFNKTPLPDVYTVDMREAENLSQCPGLSQRLLEELHYNLEHGEQSILLLNRRGYSTVIKCSACGMVADCPNCSVAMTYHTANDSLVCHYCGYIRQRATTCEHCGSGLIRYSGTGTQKLEQELAGLFPAARILRVDMDTTMAKFSHERLFGAFAAGEYDIMVGTQMVAKGLNFPEVTLVGVVNADQSLYAGDFRSFERSFSLLTQVVGRCGRGEKRGRAIVQTYSPESPVIQLAAEQDYDSFYTQEVGSRRLHLYPPFCTMAAVGFSGEALEEVQQGANAFLARFREEAAAHPSLPIRVLGPVPAEILKAAGKYRYRLLVKCRNTPETRTLFAAVLAWFAGVHRGVSAYIDMHCDRA